MVPALDARGIKGHTLNQNEDQHVQLSKLWEYKEKEPRSWILQIPYSAKQV